MTLPMEEYKSTLKKAGDRRGGKQQKESGRKPGRGEDRKKKHFTMEEKCKVSTARSHLQALVNSE